MTITQQLLDKLTAQAKENPRLRQSFDLRNSEEDDSQRMLNAIEPGSEMPIHRHKFTSETVVCLQGDRNFHTPSAHSILTYGRVPPCKA